MKERKSAGAARQHRDQAFKHEAVHLWPNSRRPAQALAEKLGDQGARLYRRKRAAGLPVGPVALTHEVVQLPRELNC